MPSESEDMEHDYFDEDPSDGTRGTNDNSDIGTVDKEVESPKNCKKKVKINMVREINDLTELTLERESSKFKISNPH